MPSAKSKKSTKSKAVSKSVKGPQKYLIIALSVAAILAIVLGGWWYYNKDKVVSLALPDTKAFSIPENCNSNTHATRCGRRARFTKLHSAGNYTFYACNRGYYQVGSASPQHIWVGVVRKGTTSNTSFAWSEDRTGRRIAREQGNSYWTNGGDGIQVLDLAATSAPSRIGAGLAGGSEVAYRTSDLIQCY